MLQFAIDFEKRANNIDRLKSINAFADVVPQPHKVNLSNPSKTILVNVIKNTCGVSVVENYKKLHKFNIRSLAGEPDPTAPAPTPKPATADAEQPGV